MPPTILDHRVICRQPGRYLAWPTIAATPDGELLVVFSGDRDEHVCPFGKNFLLRSRDHGQTWTPPQLITNSPLDDRDAGLCVCRDGTIVVSWFTLYRDSWRTQGGDGRWPAHMKSVSEKDVLDWTANGLIDLPPGRRGHFVRRSVDGGKTWQPAIPVVPSGPHGPVECTDGRLVYIGNAAYERVNKTSTLAVAESLDRGETWHVIATLPMFPAPIGPEATLAFFAEPHLVEAAPGHLVALTRYEERPKAGEDQNCFLWQFDSTDGGHSWTPPRRTDIWGKPPHLLRLRDGRLLVTYGIRHEPFGQRACFSHDGGKTWDLAHEVVLRSDAPNNDLGYPATAECADGSLATVYYQCELAGEKPVLMLTRWRA